MTLASKDPLFTQYGKSISTPKLKKNIPFKTNIQLPSLADILSRKKSHHAILQADFSPDMNIYFLEALLNHISQDNIPANLRSAELIYLDMSNSKFIKNDPASMELSLIKKLDVSDNYQIFAVYHSDLLPEYLLQSLAAHPKCRLLIFMNKQNEVSNYDPAFTKLHISGPDEADIMAMLKLQRTELEQFHNILIPDDMLGYAYSLAERYLSSNDTFEKALLLLDSSAARAAAIDRIDSSNHSKSTLSIFTLNNVVSAWTQIPAANLQLNKFKYSEFMQSMTQKIFGQDTAITLLGHELLKSEAHLQQHSSPFCSFLFTGPEQSGKMTTAIALAEQLFKQTNVLYFVEPSAQPPHSILDIKLQGHVDKRRISLKELVQQTPYAVILYENIERASSVILDQLHEILSTGYLHDTTGNPYNFRQVILILSTTLGSELLNEIEKTVAPEREASDMGLMQLVMLEQKHGAFSTPHYSPQEIADEVSTHLEKHLPASICHQLHIIPFLPLNKTAIERIIQLKLKSLGETLESRYGIELGYAQEVIRHLASEMLKNEHALKQLYFIVEQAVLSQAGNKHRPNQLFLQLNDTGQILRCDWLGSVERL